MEINNEQIYVNRAHIRANDKNPSRATIKKDGLRGTFNKSKPNEDDPFDLELKIEPSDIQRIITKATESKYCGSDDNCTGCGCNTCCSSC